VFGGERVKIKSLDELREADERTLRFTSFGFDTGGMLHPEDTALYQQESLSHAELSEAVAEGTRSLSTGFACCTPTVSCPMTCSRRRTIWRTW
jgi:hypothetical protein